MNYKTEITKALQMHGLWKHKINNAIKNGNANIDIGEVQNDKACEFGKWFYELPLEVREDEVVKNIGELHALFHSEVAKILNLVKDGQIDEAKKANEIGGKFSQISGKLVISLEKWKLSFESLAN